MRCLFSAPGTSLFLASGLRSRWLSWPGLSRLVTKPLAKYFIRLRLGFWKSAMACFESEAPRPEPMRWCASAAALGLNIYSALDEIPKAE